MRNLDRRKWASKCQGGLVWSAEQMTSAYVSFDAQRVTLMSGAGSSGSARGVTWGYVSSKHNG